MMSLEVARVLSEMKPGTHAILIYDSPENKREILMNHLRIGVYDAKLNYVCSDGTPQDVEDAMRQAGFDFDILKKEERLTIEGCGDVFFKHGKADVTGTIGYFSYLALASKRQGLDGGLRVAAEMSCFFRNNAIDELVTFERRLHRTFSFPAIGLWAYDLSELNNSGHLEPLLKLLHAQNPLIFAGPKGATVLQQDPDQLANAQKLIQVGR
jgi:hypothetical protein